ncbi:SWI/SNF chromatin-remodeling complex subunit [Marasmius crinis-equi]|uniref:SWI/SNF chromatin-remodeling complex subunit n=1 Tax=Marasmius crinis-equi TaxID=585013 RepID=A0ABR3FST5_9AGAR
MQSTQNAYPNDKFEAALRKSQLPGSESTDAEWRMKCLDCPGKAAPATSRQQGQSQEWGYKGGAVFPFSQSETMTGKLHLSDPI